MKEKKIGRRLRFKDDKGNDFPDWEEKKISQLVKISYGKDQKQIIEENGEFPILGTGGIIGRTNKFLYDKPSVLIGRKGTIDKPFYMDSPFWTVDTLFYTQVFENTFPKWLYYKFQTINWYLYNEASGVPSLSASTINQIEISLPSIEEQTKIANFLTAIDEKIANLEKELEELKAYKKGVMQALFNEDDQTIMGGGGKTLIINYINKIRFKDGNGNDFPEWKVRKLGELTTRISDGIHSTPNYCDDGDYYFINGNNLINGKVVISDNTKRVNKTEYLKHKREMDNSTILLSINGTIGSLALYNNEPIILGKSACYINIKNEINRLFVYYYLQTSTITNFFTTELTGTTIRNLSLTAIKNCAISIPIKEEQLKIANFLSAMDEKINQCSNKIGETQQYKKGLLQQMFC